MILLDIYQESLKYHENLKGKYEISVFDIRSDVMQIGFLTLNSQGSTINTSISNCLILGGISFNEKELAGESSCKVIAGGIAPVLNYNSSIKTSDVEIIVDSEGIASITLGGIVGETSGFVEDCNAKLDFDYSSSKIELDLVHYPVKLNY